jgi:CRP/FNR family transcriptional regulator
VRVSLGDSANSLALHVAGPGALLGLGETISGAAYEATVEVVEPCQIAFLRREHFLSYLRQNCSLCLQLVRALSEDLHQLYQQYRTVGGPATRIRKPRANGSEHSQSHEHQGPID